MRPEDFWAAGSLVDAYVAQSGALAYEVEAITRAVSRAERSGSAKAIHVIGVGSGRELPAIRAAAPHARIRASDISEPMVEACRQFVERQGIANVVVELSDAADLDRGDADEAADVVIALGAVLGYSTTPTLQRAVLTAFGALLRPGGSVVLVVQQRYGRPDWAAWFAGRAVLATVTGGHLGTTTGNRASRHESSSVVFHHYTRSELRSQLAQSGFDDVAIMSLRQWGRADRRRIPLRSPNPLITIASFLPGDRPRP